MPTVEISVADAGVLRDQLKRLDDGVTIYPQPNSYFHGLLARVVAQIPVPPRPLVPGDIVRSNVGKTIQGTVLGVSEGYVCFDTTGSSPYGNPFRIMLAELLERV